MGIKEFFQDKKRVVKIMWGVTMFPIAAMFLMLTLAALGVFGRIPSFEELENPKSDLATEMYGDSKTAPPCSTRICLPPTLHAT